MKKQLKKQVEKPLIEEAPKTLSFPVYRGPMPCPLIKFAGDSTPYRARYLTREQVERYIAEFPDRASWWLL